MTEPTTKPLLRFKHIRIEGLFGPENPDIEIPFNLDERVTILHGRNGSGKTICLGLIHALRSGDFSALARYPFNRMVVMFEPSASLEIRVASGAAANNDTDGRLQSRFEISTQQEATHEGISRFVIQGESNQLKLFLGTLSQLNGEWLWPLGDSKYGWVVRQLANNNPEYVAKHEREPTPEAIDPESDTPRENKLESFINQIQGVNLIRTDRLFVRSSDGPKGAGSRSDSAIPLMVDRLSEDLREDVQQVDKEYRRTSTRLDSSLRRRLFQKPEAPRALAELKAKNLELDKEEQLLLSMGLLQEAPDKVDADEITEENRDQHFVLLEDREEKLAVFRNIVAKAQRLLESLNKKLAPKTVRLDVEKGYEVRTAAGNVLPLESLSSGEQHQLVLLHELLFDVPSGSLILIDEPELSLHVTWQKDLLPELLDIARIANLDFVLATHSPYIVGDRHDLMVRLGDPV